MLARVRVRIEALTRGGLFHILGAATLNKLLAMVSSIILVRLLAKAEYGQYAYALNVVGFFLVFNGLGAVSAVLQLCSEEYSNHAKRLAYYVYGTRLGILADIFIVGALGVTAAFVPLAVPGSNLLVGLLALFPLLALVYELKLTWLRVVRDNQEYALMTNLQTVLNVSLTVLGAYLAGPVGVIAGQYMGMLATLVVLLLRSRPLPRHLVPLRPKERRIFHKIATVSALNNGVGEAMTLIGTFLVGALLLSADDVADYKVATTIPFALMFLPGAVMIYVYPHFAQHRKKRAWTSRRYKQLTLGAIVIYGLMVVLLWALARPLVTLVFSERYLSAVGAFRVLLLGFFANAVFRQPAANLLVTQRRLGVNLVNGVVSIIVNVVSSLILIPRFGILGAALAWSGTVSAGAVLATVAYIVTLRKL